MSPESPGGGFRVVLVGHELQLRVPPTIEAPFDEAAFARGVDTQLERAVEYIRTGR